MKANGGLKSLNLMAGARCTAAGIVFSAKEYSSLGAQESIYDIVPFCFSRFHCFLLYFFFYFSFFFFFFFLLSVRTMGLAEIQDG